MSGSFGGWCQPHVPREAAPFRAFNSKAMLNSIHSASARPEAPPQSPRNLPSPSAVTRFSAFLDSRLEGAGLRKAEARERGLAFHPALQRTYGRVGLGLVAWLAKSSPAAVSLCTMD